MDTKTAETLLNELKQQLAEINENNRDEHKRDAFERRAEMLIKQIFSSESSYLADLGHLSFIGMYDESEAQERSSWSRGWHRANNMLNTMLEEIRLRESALPSVPPEQQPTSNRIFVVHGHDENMKQTVARTLEALGLNPIILHEQPSKGRTIIEKLSDYADVAFAVILLSPDDLGYQKNDDPKTAKFRARQNVVLELGYFLGRLGRSRVLALYAPQEGFDIPSDYQGVIFTPYDATGGWKLNLVQELQASGFAVDANDLTRH